LFVNRDFEKKFLMDFSGDIQECYGILEHVGFPLFLISNEEKKTCAVIANATQLPSDLSSIVMMFNVCDIKLPLTEPVTNPDVTRNLFLLAALTLNKPLFDAVTPKMQHLLYTYGVPYSNPKMLFFTKFGQRLAPSNDFAQILHNVLCYQGCTSWLNQFLREEASSITGSYYMAAGHGDVEEIIGNLNRWGSRFCTENMLDFVVKHKGRPEVISFLSDKN
jgi:hypothetical protein